MSKRTKHYGRQTGGSSDKGLSPQHPYTGDGRTTRQPHDRVELDRPAPDPNQS
jgi:hypothetical protein